MTPTNEGGNATAPREVVELPPDPSMPWVSRFRFGECHVLLAREALAVPRQRAQWHLSISHPDRYPTFDEMRDARYWFCPGHITMGLLFPPLGEYVDVHQNCFHLWEVA